jgi:DNA-binding IclR family transcriptional regulator
LAAPILNEKDVAIGSIAITGIRFRLPQKKLPRFISLLKEAAGEVSGRLKNARTDDAVKTRRAGS